MAERDANGKFIKGNKASPGRKTNYEHQALQELLKQTITPDERIAVFRTLTTNAIAGDVKAATLLLAYLYGKPKENIEVTNSTEGQAPTSVVFNVLPSPTQ